MCKHFELYAKQLKRLFTLSRLKIKIFLFIAKIENVWGNPKTGVWSYLKNVVWKSPKKKCSI